MNSHQFLCCALLTAAAAHAQAAEVTAALAPFDLHRPDIVAFVNEVASRDGMRRRDVRALLKAAQPQAKQVRLPLPVLLSCHGGRVPRGSVRFVPGPAPVRPARAGGPWPGPAKPRTRSGCRGSVY